MKPAYCIAITVAILATPVIAQEPAPPGGSRAVLDGSTTKTFTKSIEQIRKNLTPADQRRFDDSMALARRLFPEPGLCRRQMHNTPAQNVVVLADRMRKELDKDRDGRLSDNELEVAQRELRSARLEANELTAIATLRNCLSAQFQAQASGVIDVNNNGVGEFGYFGELTGHVGVRTNSKQAGELTISPPLLSRSFTVRRGLVERSGYLFQLWLPAADGRAVAESRDGGVGATAPDPGNAEKVFAVYAWPMKRGVTGNRAFLVTQDGEVFATANTKQRYSSRLAAPSPYAAFPKDVTTLGYLPEKLLPSNDQGAWRTVR